MSGNRSPTYPLATTVLYSNIILSCICFSVIIDFYCDVGLVFSMIPLMCIRIFPLIFLRGTRNFTKYIYNTKTDFTIIYSSSYHVQSIKFFGD